MFLGVAKASSDMGEQDQAAMEVHIILTKIIELQAWRRMTTMTIFDD